MGPEPTPEPAHTPERAAAIRLIFQHLPVPERNQREAAALYLLQTGELDPGGLFVLRGPGGLTGAVVCVSVPGAGGLLWPPGVVSDCRREEQEDVLVRHALAWVRQRGAKLVQTLLAPEEEGLAGPLLRNGFRRVTDLWYMRLDRGTPLAGLDTLVRLAFRAFDEADPPLFRQALLRTYEETLDCPEVNGLRTVEEVLAGHRAQGIYDPGRWWLALDEGEPVGVLIVTEMPESGDWEVAYMGVVPEARRRGYGREILLKAVAEARAADVGRLLLSVDTRNRPAWHLYRAMGFEPYERRAVYLALGS
jgi:ribosomal protein S18 acetylase RimI-like enzyme